MPSTIIFAGAGPGAKDLVTLRTMRALEHADLVVHAGSLVNPQILEFCRPGCELVNSADMSLPEIIATLAQAANDNKSVVRLHTGDPGLYGAISEQMNELDRLGIAYEVIPGVTSAFASAAALNCELTMPGITQTVIFTRRAGRTPVPEHEDLPTLAANNASVAVYLSIGDIDQVAADFIAAGRPPHTPVGVVYRVSWDNQQIVRGTLADIAGKVREAGIKRQAMILVGQALDRGGQHSALYSESFPHGYRYDDRFSGSLAIYAASRQGLDKALEIAGAIPGAKIFAPQRLAGSPDNFAAYPPEGLPRQVSDNWSDFDAHLFVMAGGIAVRAIAPLIQHKSLDPAVAFCDELGNHVVSLLSGHLGGANRLARHVAAVTGGKAVISTATDVSGLPAFDDIAARHHWKVLNPEMIKTLNSMLLESQNIDLLIPEAIFQLHFSRFPFLRLIRHIRDVRASAAVTLDCHEPVPGVKILRLAAPRIAVGIGCRKNTTAAAIRQAVEDTLAEHGLSLADISAIASAGVKRHEPGLLEFAAALAIAPDFYSAEQLNAVSTPNISPRALKEFGIASVAEAAAILASNSGSLIIPKQARDSVTVAAAILNDEETP